MGNGASATVRTISIKSDDNGKNLQALAAATGITQGAHSYKIDLNAINSRIAAVPGVKKSAVRRMPNGNISIRVETHREIAQWTDGENYYPLSADGTIVRRPTDSRSAGAVVFMGALPDDLAPVTNAAGQIADKIEYMQWIEGRRWNIHTTGGITVMLPEKDPVAAISALMMMDKNHSILSKKNKPHRHA